MLEKTKFILDRFKATLIDFLIIGLIILCVHGLNSYFNLNINQFIIDVEKHQVAEYSKSTIILMIEQILIFSIYFYQYNKEESTWGKSIHSLRVVNFDNSKPSFNKLTLRFVITSFILQMFFIFFFILFAISMKISNLNTVPNILMILVTFFASIFTVFIDLIPIFFTKENLALHDILSRTKVIKSSN